MSFRSDGSDLGLYAARIRAPVGLVFDFGSSDLFVTMNQRDDLGDRTTGDALAIVSPGTNWKFPACYAQGGPACSGVPRPIALLDKHAVVGSVAILTGQLGRATSARRSSPNGKQPRSSASRSPRPVAATRDQ